MAEPQVSYLKFVVPTASWEMNVVFKSAGCACFACRDLSLSLSLSLSILPFHRRFFRHTTTMARKKATEDELSARAKENGHQPGARRDKGSLRDQNKHVDKVKKDQNAELDRYVVRRLCFPNLRILTRDFG